MRSAIVTVVAGRHRHLLEQRRSLRASRRPVDLQVVVSLGDPDLAALLAADDDGPPVTLVSVDVADDGHLPLAAGRNAGAAAALAAGADLLVFLDVDCLAGPELLDAYAQAATARPDTLLCGAVSYLSEDDTADAPLTRLARLRLPHPARPDPPPGVVVDGDHHLFWSLSFAATAGTWRRVGGFDEGYRGYGAEDTDFAARAQEGGVGLVWVGGADAYHQYHPTSTPPVQHVDDILRNGARFAQRWGTWPMPGWLDRFAELGLVRPLDHGWVRAPRLRVASVPEQHAYVTAVTPAIAEPALPGRTCGWKPDPLLVPDRLRAARSAIDVLHLHFGYEHLDVDSLERWLRVLDELRLPLVLTVHDLRNPHLVTNDRHEQHLGLLVAAAAEVITLTQGAAAEIHARYGRSATVVAHPTVLDRPLAAPVESGLPTVLLPLAALRRNVLDAGALVRATLTGAERVGGRVRVDLRPGAAEDPRASEVVELAAHGRVELVVCDRRSDDALAAYLAQAHAVVLPYRFGTHSGWIELARDLGVGTVVPSCGYYAEQATDAEVYVNDEQRGLDPQSLAVAVDRALRRPRPVPAERADRLAARAHVRATHEVIYRRALRA